MKFYLLYLLSLVSVLIEGVMLIYITVSKNRLEKINKIQKKNLKLQKKYYEGKIKQNEEVQRFRHDLKKHMKIIRVLYEEELTEELKTYLQDYIQEYPEQEIIYSGNVISDYFIGETIAQLKKQKKFEYHIMGKFPDHMKISNMDLCIIVANIMENAKNAILKLEEGGRLFVEIKNYNNHIVFRVENNKKIDDIWNKSDFGYGIKNIKAVVKKYGGNIDFLCEPEKFVVKIFL